MLKKSLLIYFAAINVWAFAGMGWDKALSLPGDTIFEKKAPRAAEVWIVAKAGVGGALGALAGAYLFNHKTRKDYLLGVLLLLFQNTVVFTMARALIKQRQRRAGL